MELTQIVNKLVGQISATGDSSREELKERFDKVNNWRFEHYQKQLDDLETYIDRQNYK